ncbi:MAG: hypothetical protein IT379_10150 [Deltaproteobacteria bacterium]|nr:hypothetical protein [Deltaproteobacteria bacterium]
MTREVSLAEILELAGRASTDDASAAERALRYPWSWPTGEPAKGAAAGGAIDPGGPSPGTVLLVSVEPAERRSLWCARASFETRSRAEARDVTATRVELVGRAAEHARAAMEIAVRALPSMASVAPVSRRAHWCVELVAKEGRGRDRALDGDSFALALVLGAASLACELSVDRCWVALAALDKSERLAPVDGLADKLALVARWAPAVTRCLVAERQLGQAAALASRLDRPLEPVGARDVGDAIAHVLGDVGSRVRLPPDPDEVRRRGRAFIRVAQLRACRRWGPVVSLGALLCSEPSVQEDEKLAADIDFATRIARRHANVATWIPWPPEDVLDRLPRPIRLSRIKHLVQTAADAGTHDAELASYVERALGRIEPEPRERYPEDLEVLGACGRALAAIEQLSDARRHLRTAIDGWEELSQSHRGSRPLCELLRIAGLEGASDEVALLIDGPVTALLGDRHLDEDELSIAFVRAAAARALTQVDRPLDAVRMVDGFARWATAAPHTRVTSLRWRARALDALGRAGDAARVRTEALQLPDVLEVADLLTLVRIDEAIAYAAPLGDLVRQLAAAGPTERARWWRDDAPTWPAERVRRVADRWRY